MTKSFCMDLYYLKLHSQHQSNTKLPNSNISTWVTLDITPEKMLDLAITRLHQCAFVGLTEHYAESFHSLCMQYNWLSPNQIPQKNTSTKFVQADQINEQSLQTIKNYHQLDIKLYQEGVKLFSKRKKTQVFISEHEQKQKICNKNAVDCIKFSFSDNIIGQGWDKRETIDENIICWSLSQHASLLFSINPHTYLYIEVHILYWLLPAFHEKLSLTINSHPITLQHQSHSKGGLLFTGLIPKQVFHTNSTLLELSFSIPELICPKTLNPNSTDLRKLGFACKAINIKPISPMSALLYRIKHTVFKNKVKNDGN